MPGPPLFPVYNFWYLEHICALEDIANSSSICKHTNVLNITNIDRGGGVLVTRWSHMVFSARVVTHGLTAAQQML